MLNFPRVSNFLPFFTIVMIGKETGHLLECVKLYRKCMNKIEAKHMLRGNIAATSLKFLWENLYSVKGNGECVFIKSIGNFWWGLIYFDQLISL